MGDMQTATREHLRTYRRLIEAESERLKFLVPLANSVHRHAILKHLQTIRAATRGLENLLKQPE